MVKRSQTTVILGDMQENFTKRACFMKCLKLLPKNALFCEDALYWIITLKGTENNESVLKNKIYCVSADKQTAKKRASHFGLLFCFFGRKSLKIENV